MLDNWPGASNTWRWKRANRRYDVGVRYGLFTAQMALALAGRDRQDVLAQMLELLAVRATLKSMSASS